MWDDIDLDAGILDVRRTLQRPPDNGLDFLPPKTKASERRIALPDECIQALKEHRERQVVERETGRDDVAGARTGVPHPRQHSDQPGEAAPLPQRTVRRLRHPAHSVP